MPLRIRYALHDLARKLLRIPPMFPDVHDCVEYTVTDVYDNTLCLACEAQYVPA